MKWNFIILQFNISDHLTLCFLRVGSLFQHFQPNLRNIISRLKQKFWINSKQICLSLKTQSFHCHARTWDSDPIFVCFNFIFLPTWISFWSFYFSFLLPFFSSSQLLCFVFLHIFVFTFPTDWLLPESFLYCCPLCKVSQSSCSNLCFRAWPSCVLIILM